MSTICEFILSFPSDSAPGISLQGKLSGPRVIVMYHAVTLYRIYILLRLPTHHDILSHQWSCHFPCARDAHTFIFYFDEAGARLLRREYPLRRSHLSHSYLTSSQLVAFFHDVRRVPPSFSSSKYAGFLSHNYKTTVTRFRYSPLLFLPHACRTSHCDIYTLAAE